MPSTAEKKRTDKMRRCMEQVSAKGHTEDSACAICTTSLQNVGEMVFEGLQEHASDVRVLASAEPRELHLLGATGQVRYEMLNDRRHLVVPVVALMEGVIHPVNADTPEFVSQAVLQKAAASWVGKPVTLGHPKKNGTQCSATDAEVRKSAGLGVIMLSEWKNNRLLQEAWIDEEKAKSLHPSMYEALAAGGREEVSVGAFVITSAAGGNYNGKVYKATWLETQGDHLAFLPGGRGACSCDMGCGTHRAAGDNPGHPFHGNQYSDTEGWSQEDQDRRANDGHQGSPTPREGDRVKIMGKVQHQGKKGTVSGSGSFVYVKTDKGEHLGSYHVSDLKVMEEVGFHPTHFIAACGRPEESLELLPEGLPLLTYTTLQGESLDDRIRDVQKAIDKQYANHNGAATPSSYAYSVQVFDDRVIIQKDGEYYSVPYTVNKDGNVALGAQTKVEQQWVAASVFIAAGVKKECATCGGTGQMKNGAAQSDCAACDGEGYLKAAAGARHSSADIKMIQTVHDHAAALGATCDRKNLATAQAIPPAPQLRVAVRQEGTKWVLYSTDGKRRLAEHNTEADANKQAEAIRAALAKPCG